MFSWFGRWFSGGGWFGRWFGQQAPAEPPVEPPAPGEPTTVEPLPVLSFSDPISRPAGYLVDGAEPATEDDRCVVSELMAVPAPSRLSVECVAGPVHPPPPPPPGSGFVSIRIKEEGPVKQLGIWPGVTTGFGSEDWIVGNIGFPADLPFGEKVLMGFGGLVLVPGVGVTQAGGVSTLSTVSYFGEVLLGSRNGNRNLAPRGALRHLPPNSVWLRIPGVWHGGSAPLTILSYRPFRAVCCLTNSINGQNQPTQVLTQQGVGVLVGHNWSANYNIYAGSTIKLTFEEVVPGAG